MYMYDFGVFGEISFVATKYQSLYYVKQNIICLFLIGSERDLVYLRSILRVLGDFPYIL